MNHEIKNIALIGIGGGGMNTLHQLLLDKVPVARFIAVNRNKLFLNASRADKKIQLNAPKNAPEVIIKICYFCENSLVQEGFRRKSNVQYRKCSFG